MRSKIDSILESLQIVNEGMKLTGRDVDIVFCRNLVKKGDTFILDKDIHELALYEIGGDPDFDCIGPDEEDRDEVKKAGAILKEPDDVIIPKGTKLTFLESGNSNGNPWWSFKVNNSKWYIHINFSLNVEDGKKFDDPKAKVLDIYRFTASKKYDI